MDFIVAFALSFCNLYTVLPIAVFFLELLCDDDISLFIDILDDFKAVDDVKLLMIDDYLLMIDYIDIYTKDIICSGRTCSLLLYIVTS